MNAVLQAAVDAIEQNKTLLNDVSQIIWSLKELKFQEKQSHAYLCGFLENQLFDVQRTCGPLETAFVATWGSKSEDGTAVTKPHICVICEYDALPEIGHACGHNLIAEIGVAAALGIKAAMKEHGIKGKLTVLGTPAEEGGGGKVDMMQAGAFNDVDIALMTHPAPFSDARPIFLSTDRFEVNFQGKSSHAAGFPWEGINALDAAVQAYTSIGGLRQQMKPDWRASVIITKGGTVPNIIPSEAEMKCQVRTAKESEMDDLQSKVKRCITAAADATGCTVSIANLPKPYKSLISNETLAQLYESSLEALGVKVTVPSSKIGDLGEAPFILCLVGGNRREDGVLFERETCSCGTQVLGSTDMGNVSHVIPSLHPCYNCNTTAFNHTVEFTAAAGSPDAQVPTLTQGKALAMTALKVLCDPSLLDDIRLHFKRDMENA